MKKLNILKTIVDYVWIFSVIFYPVIIVVAIMLLIDINSNSIPIKITEIEADLDTLGGKIALLLSVLNLGLLLIVLFNFKKLLTNFKNRQIFEIEIYLLLKKIGKLLIYSSFFNVIAETIARRSTKTVAIELGFGPFLYLLSIGLFFLVLSEVFKIGKHIKEENELTI